LRYREELLVEWDKLGFRNKLDLLWHSLGAFVDALWLQPSRPEDEMFQDLRFDVRTKHSRSTDFYLQLCTLAALRRCISPWPNASTGFGRVTLKAPYLAGSGNLSLMPKPQAGH
jgi:hypothetical protein